MEFVGARAVKERMSIITMIVIARFFLVIDYLITFSLEVIDYPMITFAEKAENN